ncbi:MAG: hypothetical protein OEQ15_05445 [Nitrosopumilus sp.]|nr:hypothetical protein [Nitrosopumilus sp.]
MSVIDTEQKSQMMLDDTCQVKKDVTLVEFILIGMVYGALVVITNYEQNRVVQSIRKNI